MILSTHGILSSTGSAFLLDIYPNAAVAYSIRKLRTAYTGSAIRVRRSSDNAEQNIGFSGENLDITSLTSFCSGTDGFVTTWYDQSGNGRNATQSTAAKQPPIVTSGFVLTTNGKPALKWSGGNYSLRTAIFTTINQPITTFITAQIDQIGASCLLDGAILNGQFLIYRNTNTDLFYSMGSPLITTSITNNQLLISFLGNTSSSEIYNNNTLKISGNIGPNAVDGFSLGNLSLANENIGFQLNGAYQEFVFYPSNQSTNLSAINTNINSYYAIY